MQLRRSPISLVVVSVYYYSYYSCLFSSLSWSFTDFVLFRIPRATTYRTTLIQYTDDHTPTPFSEKVPASPYKALMPKEAVPLPAPLVLPRPKQAVSVPVAAVKAASVSKSPKTTTVPEEKELSLYEVLGVSPTATREEMKLRYNALVKRHHPDAVKHRPRPRLMFVGPGSATHSFSSSHPHQQQDQQQAQKAIKKEPDFGEITAAWAVLSDDKARRKYDRGLLYQKWADQASKVAMKTMEEAAPVMAKMMDKVALPLMETTAVSTAKIAKAAYQRMEDTMIISTVKASAPDVPPAANNNNNKNVKKTIASPPPPPAAASVSSVVVQEKDLGGVSSISMNEVVSKITLPVRPVANAPVPPEKTTPWVPTPPPTTSTSRTKATTTSSTAPFFSNPVVVKPTTMTETNQKMMKKLEPVSTTKKPTMSTDAMRKLPLWTLLLQMILFV